jgi:putative endonuclease
VRADSKGAAGERAAERFLEQEGYSIVARNFRTRRGEIDLIVRRGGRVAFVEVKTWDALGASELEHAIDWRKQQRIRQASRAFLAGRPDLQELELGYDVVFVQGASIRYLPGVFDGV